MALAVLVRLLNGRYDAGGLRRDEPEWPPHPARLFCALAASAIDEGDWAALRWLESRPAPEVWASPQAAATARSGYVVTNERNIQKGSSQTWPGRTNGPRIRTGAIPACAEFAVCWQDAEPDDVLLAVLRRLARRIPYVGRSTSPAVVTAGLKLPQVAEWRCWRPARSDERGTARLRVPYPGYVDELDAAYADGRRAWEVGRAAAYTRADAPHDQSRPP